MSKFQDTIRSLAIVEKKKQSAFVESKGKLQMPIAIPTEVNYPLYR